MWGSSMKRVTRLPSLPRRDKPAHKGSFGHVLIVGGAVGMSGAVALAGRAASRGGAGLVTIACPADNQPIVATLVPEALTIPLPQRPDGRVDPKSALDALGSRAGGWTVLAAGCGWGTADAKFARQSVAMMRGLAGIIGGPTVLDADGLNLLAQTRDLEREPWSEPQAESRGRVPIGGSLIITPHPGELGRLLDCSTEDIQADRIAAAADAASRFHKPVVVLKGTGTIVTDGDRYYVNKTGNPGMATGGTGDVLTGLLAALLAQGLEPFDAAVLGVYVHGLAGDLAARKVGQVSLIAPDLADFIGPAMTRTNSRKPR